MSQYLQPIRTMIFAIQTDHLEVFERAAPEIVFPR